jgi:hypothetical protein
MCDPLLDKFRETAVGVVSRLFDFSRVNDIDDVVDGDRSLQSER